MLVWSGWGILALLIGAAGGMAGTGLAVALGDRTDMANYGTAIGLVAAGVGIWFAGKALNKPQQGFDPRSGAPVLYTNRHRFFFIPMQFWGPIAALGGLGALIVRAVA